MFFSGKCTLVVTKSQNYSCSGLENQLLHFLVTLFFPHQGTQKALSSIYHTAALPTLLEICSFDVKLTEGNGRSLTDFNGLCIVTKRDQTCCLSAIKRISMTAEEFLYISKTKKVISSRKSKNVFYFI